MNKAKEDRKFGRQQIQITFDYCSFLFKYATIQNISDAIDVAMCLDIVMKTNSNEENCSSYAVICNCL